jgi:hypothetical protein
VFAFRVFVCDLRFVFLFAFRVFVCIGDLFSTLGVALVGWLVFVFSLFFFLACVVFSRGLGYEEKKRERKQKPTTQPAPHLMWRTNRQCIQKHEMQTKTRNANRKQKHETQTQKLTCKSRESEHKT